MYQVPREFRKHNANMAASTAWTECSVISNMFIARKDAPVLKPEPASRRKACLFAVSFLVVVIQTIKAKITPTFVEYLFVR